MTLRFLKWREAAKTDLPWPDVYFSPQYGAAAEASDAAPWEVAVWEEGPIVTPYLVRSIPFSQSLGTLRDITSPYGYSGTWAPADVPISEWHAFRAEFRSTMRERGIIAEFQRLHPLLSQEEALGNADPSVTLRHHNDTVVVDIRQGYDAWWSSVEGRVRTAVRKARREGFVGRIRAVQAVDVEPESPFRTLYRSTMHQVGAAEYFFFPNEYFSRLHEQLADHLLLADVVWPDGRLAAAALFMKWGPMLHYHLAASEPQGARLGANALLLETATAWGIRHGFDWLHIGGGRAPRDGLFLFKRAFGSRVVPFYVAQSVLDEAAYEGLLRDRAASTNRPREALVADGYFPAYRA